MAGSLVSGIIGGPLGSIGGMFAAKSGLRKAGMLNGLPTDLTEQTVKHTTGFDAAKKKKKASFLLQDEEDGLTAAQKNPYNIENKRITAEKAALLGG